MVALAVAASAMVLGSGVSAALTHGRSVNPLDGIEVVVAQLSGGRTPDQAAARKDASEALERADRYARKGQNDEARAELAQVEKLVPKLSDDDRKAVRQRAADVKGRIGR